MYVTSHFVMSNQEMPLVEYIFCIKICIQSKQNLIHEKNDNDRNCKNFEKIHFYRLLYYQNFEGPSLQFMVKKFLFYKKKMKIVYLHINESNFISIDISIKSQIRCP